jgi:putative ABC transport system permease protein
MPDWKTEIRRRLASLKLEPKREAAIVEELANDLDDCYAAWLASGASEATAYQQTLAELQGSEWLRRELGHFERQSKQEPILLGTNRRTTMIADLWQDLRFGARAILKQPAFTLIAVLTLALGIGANTAIFSVVNAVLLRPLPFKEPAALVTLWEESARDGVAKQRVAPGNYSDWKAQQTSFAQMAAIADSELNLTGNGEPEKLTGYAVMTEFLSLLGARPALGRDFTPNEGQPGAPKVALISHDFWQRRLGGERGALSKELLLNDEKYTVVGVMPAGFQFLNPEASFWVPAVWRPQMLAYRRGHYLTVIARLKPGVTQTQAQADLGAIMEQTRRAYPEETGKLGVLVEPLHAHLVGDAQRSLLLLLAGVGCVLLIACANLAGLLLARAARRRREIAVRSALGAGRARIVRQLLTESILLAIAGGLGGLLVAQWSFAVLQQLIPANLSLTAALHLDWRMLAYTLALALVTGLLFGLAPAWQAAHVNVNEVLKQSGGRTSAGHHRWQRGMVVAQVALTLVLLIGAGLLLRTFYRLRGLDVGFRADNVLTAQIRLPRNKYLDHTKREAFYQQTLERVRALPGVVSAGYTSNLPLVWMSGIYQLEIEGRAPQPGLIRDAVHRQVSADYLKTIGIPLRQGRYFDEGDTLANPLVVVINETLARRDWPNENPLGRRIRLSDGADYRGEQWLTVVGVVADAKQNGLEAAVKPEMYLPSSQVTYNYFSIPSWLVVRTTAAPLHLAEAVRRAVFAIAPDLPLSGISTMEARLAEQTAQRRFAMTLLTGFAVLSLLLAALGIYGVLSYFVAQQTSEIGVRVALGAQASDVLRLVLSRGMTPVQAGIVLGLLSALALTRLMDKLLFGVSATDPLTFTSVALLLTLVAFVACWIPARRATRVDPLIALRHE